MKARRPFVVTAGLAAVTLALAPAALATNHTVQIAGQLVSPSHVSAVQAAAETPSPARVVQIGGRLVRPEQVSATEQQLSSSYKATSNTSGGQAWWKLAGISTAAVAFALLVGATLINRRPLRVARA